MYRIAQLTKAPRHGEVKTRMRPVLDNEQCLALHRAMTEWQVERFFNLSSLGGIPLFYELWVSVEHTFFNELRSRYAINTHLQVSGNLGVRLNDIVNSHAAHDSLTASILIGSDCPFIDEALLLQVHQTFMDKNIDGLIVPARDGGYVLLACREAHSCLFQDITWGSEKVYEQTLSAAKKAGLKFVSLAAYSDIDRPDDLILLEGLGGGRFAHFSGFTAI